MDFNLTRSHVILERTPGVLQAFLTDLSEEWATPNEGPDTFSAFDNVAHLAYTERTNWIRRAQIILEHRSAMPFPPLDRLGHYKESKGKSMTEVLDEFAELRAERISLRYEVGTYRRSS